MCQVGDPCGIDPHDPLHHVLHCEKRWSLGEARVSGLAHSQMRDRIQNVHEGIHGQVLF